MKKKDLLFIFLLLVLSIPAVLPLLHHGFFQTDDGEWMIIRLSAFYQALHDGQFPVRFLQRLNFGYGYPVAEFLYPGSFYFASLFHIIRFGFVNSIKIVYGLSLIGSAVFTYLWLRKLFARIFSFIGALFALYIPYHLYDVYTRGSAEVFALLWVPFILWQIERRSIFWIAVGIGLLLLSHNTMALLFLPVLFIYALLRKVFPLRFLFVIFIFGILLSSFFIIPAVFELHNTVFSQTAVSNPQIYFASLPLIGFSVLLIIVTTFLMLLFRSNKVKHDHSLVIFFFIVSLLAIFLSTPLSSFLWRLPQASLIQFPFRFLSYFVISIAFLACYLVGVVKKWQQIAVCLILSITLLYSVIPYSNPKIAFDKGEGYYYTNDATTTVKDEYMPVWVKQKPRQRPEQLVVLPKGDGQISDLLQKSNSVAFTADLRKNVIVQINIIYWPGWHAMLDGQSVSIDCNNPQGVMMIAVPKGQHLVKFSFGENPIRLFSDIISLLALIGLIVFAKKYHLK